MTLQYVPVRAVPDFPGAFDSIARGAPEGLIALPDTLISHQAKAIAEFGAKRRIPTISAWSEFAEAGNLISYGPRLRDFYRQIAVYVDKILNGAKPADLPVEYPTTFELIINLKAAKTLGLTIPQSRADQVIEYGSSPCMLGPGISCHLYELTRPLMLLSALYFVPTFIAS